MFYLLFFEAVLISYLDIRYRRVGNGYLLLVLLTGIVLLVQQHRVPDISNYVSVLIIIFIGIFASLFNIWGAADSKLLAIWGILISSDQLLFFGFMSTVTIFVSCLLFYLVAYFKPAIKLVGLPLIPAISLSGIFCFWLS